ncbi:malonyl-CoA decarboxylase, mitochondrial [Anabrus simplex]|uniref:malonyl-CoA decarboxylase, mitochondrial n=1 Tax=Anabrus simplex TaxID=316456 RepID=UPI0035A3862F
MRRGVRVAQLNGALSSIALKNIFFENTSRGYYSIVPHLSRMASGDPDNLKNRTLFTRPRCDARKNTGNEDVDDPDDIFSSPEHFARRPSTIDDEHRLEKLLKEVLAYRDTNVSSWIVESKVKILCSAYRYLLKPHKDGFLKVLACEHSVDHQMVCKAAKSLVGAQQEECDKFQVIKGEERLKNLLTPQYSWLFIHMGRLEKGVKFLVDLRTDVLTLLSELDVKDPSALPLQQLNLTLKEMLSLWFSVGFLNLERVTWKSPCEMLQKISEYEAVHPVRSWTDLKRRVGPYRRCFVYTHSSMPDEPLVVLHTALSDEIASSMKGIVSAASRMSMDTSAFPSMSGDPVVEDPNNIKAAIFYSISSTQKGLQGIELGNYLIKRVVRELQAEFPLVTKFSSLSPIPTFRSWLMDKIKAAEKGQTDILLDKEIEDLQAYLKTDNLWAELKRLFKTNGWISDIDLIRMMETPLMRLCARYLYLEKRRGYALDSVANFHLRNGAVMWRLNWQANLTPRGLDNSCGIMVNYRYFLEETERNSRAYLEKQHIATSDQIQKLAGAANALMKVTSKI